MPYDPERVVEFNRVFAGRRQFLGRLVGCVPEGQEHVPWKSSAGVVGARDRARFELLEKARQAAGDNWGPGHMEEVDRVWPSVESRAYERWCAALEWYVLSPTDDPKTIEREGDPIREEAFTFPASCVREGLEVQYEHADGRVTKEPASKTTNPKRVARFWLLKQAGVLPEVVALPAPQEG